MSSIRLYLDEDATQHALVAALRLRGIDVTSALDEHLIAATDQKQLEWSQENGRVIYTFNVGDFHRLHREYVENGMPHAGIIIAAQRRYSVGEQMRRLLRMHECLTAEQMLNRIDYLSNWN